MVGYRVLLCRKKTFIVKKRQRETFWGLNGAVVGLLLVQKGVGCRKTLVGLDTDSPRIEIQRPSLGWM
jgi:hypothetical protein